MELRVQVLVFEGQGLGCRVQGGDEVPSPRAWTRSARLILKWTNLQWWRDGFRGRGDEATEGPLWGHPRCGLGAVGAVLEPFCGHLSPKIDKVY